MKILLSIRPEFVESIKTGNKKFEYRKNIFKNTEVNSIVLYATKPFGKVVGEFSIEDIIEDNPAELWSRTKEYSGITQKYFDEYFQNHTRGFAIKIKKFIEYKRPLSLQEVDKKIKIAPQSFCYIDM